MTDHRIFKAGPDDAETIFDFIYQLALYEKEPEAVETSPDVLRQQLSQAVPPFECLLLEAAGRVEGFALFFHNYSTWRGRPGIYLEDLFVNPDCRGQGFGLALLKKLAQLALERGAPRMEWVCLEWNEPAKQVYRKIGAQALDDWRVWRLADESLRDFATNERAES